MPNQDKFIAVAGYTSQDQDRESRYPYVDFFLYDDCATGDVEIELAHKTDGVYNHGFGLLVGFDASFNSNLQNSEAILVSKLKVKNAFAWYSNGGTNEINYVLGDFDKVLIELAVKQAVVSRIKEDEVRTILRPAVLDINFMNGVSPEKRSYKGESKFLEYVDVDYINKAHKLELFDGDASGSLCLIIEGQREVIVNFKASYSENCEIGTYVGGVLSTPKVADILNIKITALEMSGFYDRVTKSDAEFPLAEVEIEFIKKRIVDEIRNHHEADAYPQGKEHYLNN